MLAEIVVEADDAVHFGAREIQSFGYAAHCFGRDIAEFLLDSVKDGQQGPGLVRMTGDDAIDRGHALGVEI
jgi:hypothetical protein